MNLTPEQLKLKEEIKLRKQLFFAAKYDYYTLKSTCSHVIVNNRDSANCIICEDFFGWYCQNSPTHICEYDGETCIYCGLPDERK